MFGPTDAWVDLHILKDGVTMWFKADFYNFPSHEYGINLRVVINDKTHFVFIRHNTGGLDSVEIKRIESAPLANIKIEAIDFITDKYSDGTWYCALPRVFCYLS
jgi:hypothetical protein